MWRVRGPAASGAARPFTANTAALSRALPGREESPLIGSLASPPHLQGWRGCALHGRSRPQKPAPAICQGCPIFEIGYNYSGHHLRSLERDKYIGRVPGRARRALAIFDQHTVSPGMAATTSMGKAKSLVLPVDYSGQRSRSKTLTTPLGTPLETQSEFMTQDMLKHLTTPKGCPWDTMPDELKTNVLSFLSATDRIRCMSVSQSKIP